MLDQAALPNADDLLKQFHDVPTGVITDAFLRLGINGWMDEVLPLAAGSRIVGRARTIAYGPVRRSGKLQESMYALMSRMSPGEVIVIGSGGTHDNLLGDNMGTFAHRCGLAGIVTDSKTRDRQGLRDLGMPVFSRGAGVRPPVEVELQAYDVVLDCGGAQVRPGDIIVGDDDGVVVVPAERAEEVLYQIADLREAEGRIKGAITGSATLKEIEQEVAKKKVVKVRAAK